MALPDPCYSCPFRGKLMHLSYMQEHYVRDPVLVAQYQGPHLRKSFMVF
jgi:hypothetical protein